MWAFAIYDGDITLHRVEYDLQKVFDLMKKAGFNDYYYGCLATGANKLCKLPSTWSAKMRARKDV